MCGVTITVNIARLRTGLTSGVVVNQHKRIRRS